MAQEHQITQPLPLHNKQGLLQEVGYAFQPYWIYSRSAIRAAKFRIKEWDYYEVSNDEYAVALTLSDLGYVGLLSVSLIDYKKAQYLTQSDLVILPMGKFKMPEDSRSGVSAYETKKASLEFVVENGVRTLKATYRDFYEGKDFSFEATLADEPEDSMNIVVPWKEDKKAFYYNRKIVGMSVDGTFSVGDFSYRFKPEETFGLLDWGRGVWTYDNTWYWAFAKGWQTGDGSNDSRDPKAKRFGLNMGYGFGDTSIASENMAFIDGKGYKLGELKFEIVKKPVEQTSSTTPLSDQYEFMQEWRFTDEAGLIDVTFTPILDRFDFMQVAVVTTDQHQVFGEYSGTIVIEGKPFVIKGLKGAAEVVHNRY